MDGIRPEVKIDGGALQKFWEEYSQSSPGNENAKKLFFEQYQNKELCRIIALHILDHSPSYKDAIFLLNEFSGDPRIRIKTAEVIIKDYPDERDFVESIKGKKVDISGHSASMCLVIRMVPERFEKAWKTMVRHNIENGVLEQFIDMCYLPDQWAGLLAEKAVALYIEKNSGDNNCLSAVVWKYPKYAEFVASRILENNPDIETLSFLACHSRAIGYETGVKVARKILEGKPGALSLAAMSLWKASLFAIIRGYMDFISDKNEGRLKLSLLEQTSREYQEIAERTADLIFSFRRLPLTGNLIDMIRCLPSRRMQCLRFAIRNFGEAGVRYILYRFRLWSAVIEHGQILFWREREGAFSDPKHITYLAAKWLLKNGKEEKTFDCIIQCFDKDAKSKGGRLINKDLVALAEKRKEEAKKDPAALAEEKREEKKEKISKPAGVSQGTRFLKKLMPRSDG